MIRRFPYVMPSEKMLVALVLLALASASFRGIDYLFFPQEPYLLSPIETAAPITAWGLFLLFGVLIVLLGNVVERWPLAIFGHAVLAGIFVALGVGSIIGGLEHVAGEGFRQGISYMFVESSVHVLLTMSAWRRWDAQRD